MTDLKTTPEWIEASPYEIIILDPDGWDRKRLVESYAEKITYMEFLDRLASSTVQCSPEVFTKSLDSI